MRSIKREAKGISPVIATILLIAVTAVAGGVIAAYVAGLYVAGGRLIIASADGFVYDYDNSPALENYKNSVASITVVLQPGSTTMRSFGDSAEGGTTITVTNAATGFSATATFPDNKTQWGTQLTYEGFINVPGWNTADDNDVRMEVVVSPSRTGTLGAGSLISITLQPFSITDARSYETSGTRDIRENRTEYAALWDKEQTFNVTISGRDSLSLKGYDGAYMSTSRWSE